MKVLEDYFIPKANVPFEIHLFRQIAQEMGETVDQLVCRLRQRAASCDFGDNEDDYIRDKVIDKCHSSVIRRKFLEKGGAVRLDDLLRIARSQEAVDRQMKVMGTNASTDQVNTVGGKSSINKHSAGVKICFGFGQDGHFRGDKRCPARDQACRRCGGIGHFMVRCPQLQSRTRGEFRGSTSGGRGVTGRGRVRLVEAEVKLVEVEVLLMEEGLDLVEQEKQTKWLAEMMVNNLPDQFSRVLSMHSW